METSKVAELEALLKREGFEGVDLSAQPDMELPEAVELELIARLRFQYLQQARQAQLNLIGAKSVGGSGIAQYEQELAALRNLVLVIDYKWPGAKAKMKAALTVGTLEGGEGGKGKG